MTCEPLGDDLADGDAAHLVAHGKDGKADAGDGHLVVVAEEECVARVG